MKVGGAPNIAPSGRVHRVAATPKTESSTGGDADTVRLTGFSRAVCALMQDLRTAQTERGARVEELAALVASGRYEVDVGALAQAIAEE